jgi:H+/gluconate symporter-like permease
MFTLNDLLVVFLIGVIIGALLSRGGGRPGRYYD